MDHTVEYRVAHDLLICHRVVMFLLDKQLKDSYGILFTYKILCVITVCVSQQLDQPRGPWTLVFKAVQGKTDPRHGSTTAFLMSTDTVNEDSLAARTDFTLSSDMYKSSLAHDWSRASVQAVKLSFFKNNTEEVYAVFDAHGKTPVDWFDCSVLIRISYPNFPAKADRACIFDLDKNRKFFLGGVSFCNVGFTMMKDADADNPLCAALDSLNLHDRPYFLYSKNGNDWDPNNDLIPDSDAFDNADTLAIFVQVWVTAMKGVSGSVYDLWTEATIMSADPSLSSTTSYKSNLVESWSTRFIDQVKFALFNLDLQKAYVVFSATGNDKNAWFECSNILYSSYTDLNSSSASTCSLHGDNSRRYLLMKVEGTCAEEEAWSAVLNDETNVTSACQWDNVTRPRYFYSAEPTAVLTMLGGIPNSEFAQADMMGIFVHDWHLVLKVAAGGSLGTFTSVYDLWTASGTLNENEVSAKLMTSGTATFKSFFIDDWDTRYIKANYSAQIQNGYGMHTIRVPNFVFANGNRRSLTMFYLVKMSFYKGGQEVAYIVLDATGTTRTSWLDCDRILYTSYIGAMGAVCGMEGEITEKRRFVVASTTTDCATFSGWQITVDTDSPTSCFWEQSGAKPLFLYSGGPDSLASGMQQAEVMAIFIDTDECSPNPCKNGGTCEDIVADFNCTCVNNYYGKKCSNLDGGFGVWSTFGTCSATCAPGGTQTRSRTCTDPPPEVDGLNCTGAYLESQTCNNFSCPVDGGFSNWTSWSNCSASCAPGGTQSRLRTCSNPSPAFGGQNCSGVYADSQICNNVPCPVDGGFAAWTLWSTCSASCLPGGIRTRSRTCTNPTPQFGGLNCTEAFMESETCKNISCPVDGGFEPWTTWSNCSATCVPGGTQSRSRTCTNPTPKFGGLNCSDSFTELQICNEKISCSVYGSWSDFSWQPCDVTCGVGVRSAVRTCTNTTPGFEGNICPGSNTLFKECRLKPCTCSKEDKKYDCFWDKRSSAHPTCQGTYWLVVIGSLSGCIFSNAFRMRL